MSDKFCCVTWDELYPELSQVKSNEIDSLVKEKGIPRSVFAGVIKLLNGLNNYCPYCGTCLNKDIVQTAQPVVNQQRHVQALKEVQEVVDSVPTPKQTQVRCQACAGRGILGQDKNKVNIRCMKCHGEGTFMSKHIAEDPRAKYAQGKVDQVREEKGYGDDTVFAPGE